MSLYRNGAKRPQSHSGAYILERAHPRDYFGMGKSTENWWTVDKDQISVDIEWGHEGDKFNPITEIDQVSTRLHVKNLT